MRLRGVTTGLVCLGLVATSACSIERLGGGTEVAARADEQGGSAVSATTVPAGETALTSGGPARAGGGAAGGSGGAGAVSAPAANVEAPADARQASDRGVTPDTLLLGVLATDEDTFGEFGVTYRGKRHEEVVQPFIDEINEQGGINGRKLEVKVVRYSPLSTDDMQAACVAVAEDHKVFAAIAPIGFWGDAEVCLANKETPLLTGNNSSADTNNRREQGWVRQTLMNKDRLVKNWVDWMIATGQVGPQTKHAVVYTDVPEDRQLVLEVVIPYMKQRGLQAPEVAAFSMGTADTGTAEGQAAVLKFKSAGVELVWPVTNFLQWYLFLQQAEAAQYRPRYTASDFGAIATDVTYFYPASQWEGVRGFTVTRTGERPLGGMPEWREFGECLRVYREHGKDIDPDPDDESQLDALEIANVGFYCEHLALFADAARRAGVNPTRQSFLAAVGDTGTWSHRVALTERLTFAPDKYDGADFFAVVQWKPECNSDGGCYRQVEGFRPGTW